MKVPLIQLDEVHKIFGEGATRVEAIRGITLSIGQGEFVAILGKSGSGKSTLISLLGGLEQATLGSVKFNGEELTHMSQDDLAILRRTEIGIVFQHFHLMEMFTTVENTELPLLINKTSKRERRPMAVQVLERVGLEGRLSNYPNELSGGEKQRVGIARALINRPKLILADEPTGDLDSTTGDVIIDLLEEINNDPEWAPTIIMVTHDVTKLRKGMRVLLMSDGEITTDVIYDGSNPEIFDRFGIPAEIIGKQEYDTKDITDQN